MDFVQLDKLIISYFDHFNTLLPLYGYLLQYLNHFNFFKIQWSPSRCFSHNFNNFNNHPSPSGYLSQKLNHFNISISRDHLLNIYRMNHFNIIPTSNDDLLDIICIISIISITINHLLDIFHNFLIISILFQYLVMTFRVHFTGFGGGTGGILCALSETDAKLIFSFLQMLMLMLILLLMLMLERFLLFVGSEECSASVNTCMWSYILGGKDNPNSTVWSLS